MLPFLIDFRQKGKSSFRVGLLLQSEPETHVRMISEIVEGDLATKQDIERLENKLVQLEYRLIIKLGAVIGAIVTLAIAVTAAITKLL